jgi:hypothetical protein
MRIPQTVPEAAERIKEVPAQALRAVFAGVGQVLLITERVRRRTAGDDRDGAPAQGDGSGTEKTEKAAGTAAAHVPSPRDGGTGEAAPAPETPAAAAKSAAPKDAAPKDAGAPDAGVLPVPHYSELSIASLRARMRGLDVGQLRELLSYERAHEDRENVIAMFERRIAKLDEEATAAGGTD